MCRSDMRSNLARAAHLTQGEHVTPAGGTKFGSARQSTLSGGLQSQRADFSHPAPLPQPLPIGCASAPQPPQSFFTPAPTLSYWHSDLQLLTLRIEAVVQGLLSFGHFVGSVSPV